jgi:hypothetical protein
MILFLLPKVCNDIKNDPKTDDNDEENNEEEEDDDDDDDDSVAT